MPCLCTGFLASQSHEPIPLRQPDHLITRVRLVIRSHGTAIKSHRTVIHSHGTTSATRDPFHIILGHGTLMPALCNVIRWGNVNKEEPPAGLP